MKKLKIVTIILAILVITMVSFFGVYVLKQNRMENKVKEYSLAMDLKGTRNVRLKVDESSKTIVKDSEGKEVTDAEDLTDAELTEKGYSKEEVAYNGEEVLNQENYNTSKKIIEKRLKKLGAEDYIIKVDGQTGDILIEIPEDDNTDSIVENLESSAKFEIVDSQTNEILMNNDDIKLVNVMYGSDSTSTSNSSGTIVYLNIEFTKEGAKKLEEISNTYVATDTTQTDENEEESEESTTKKEITMKIDDEEIMTTDFEEPIKTGKMQLSVGKSSTDQETLQEYISQASIMAAILDSGKMPVKYEVSENEYVLSDITDNERNIACYVIAGIVAISLVLLVIRYKKNGLLGAISYIGMAAILMLIIRYANVILSLEGIFGIIITLVLNYIFINKLLSKFKKEKLNKEVVKNKVKETYKEFFIKIVPIIITAITFCFIKWTPISSFGMVMFWGISLIALYNFIVTNQLFKIKASK